MNEYKREYVFSTNDEGQIVAQSIDRMHHFILPLDLNSIDMQKTIFEILLMKCINNNDDSSKSFSINLDLFKSAIGDLDGINDENVTLAVFEYLYKNEHYSFNEDGNISILEEINSDILDRPIVLQKWAGFYDHLLTSTSHAMDICNEIYERFTDRLKNLPDKITTLNGKLESNVAIHEKYKEKIESGAILTAEDQKKKRSAEINMVRYNNQLKDWTDEVNDPEILKQLNEYLIRIKHFLDDGDIYISAYESSKSIIEAGKAANESEMKYALKLTEKVGNLGTLSALNQIPTEDELSDENLSQIAQKFSQNNLTELSENEGAIKQYKENMSL